MLSNLHSQSVKSPARIFVILEDQKLFKENFWKEVLYPNIDSISRDDFFSNISSYKLRLDNSSTSGSLSPLDSMPVFSRCLENLEGLEKSKEFKNRFNVRRKLDYLLKCLGHCRDIIQSIWTAERGFETVIEISCLSDMDNPTISHPLKNPENYNFESDMPQLVFWCLDTDGLQLNQKVLNHQRSHISVKPLRNFIYSGKSKQMKKLDFMQHPQYIHINASSNQSSNIELQNSTDHFLILLHPNAEVLEYSMHEESKIKLKYHITKENVKFKKGKSKHGTKMFIGIGLLLKNSDSEPNPIFRSEMLPSVQNLFLDDKLLFHSFSDANEDEFLKYVKPSPLRKNRYEGNVLAGSFYIKKGGKWNQTFPLIKSTTKINQDISDILTVFKWTNCIDEESASMVWSEPHRCNGKTMIPLHPDHVSEEILEKYGRNVYGGFKPCQRIVKNSLRCWNHE